MYKQIDKRQNFHNTLVIVLPDGDWLVTSLMQMMGSVRQRGQHTSWLRNGPSPLCVRDLRVLSKSLLSMEVWALKSQYSK